MSADAFPNDAGTDRAAPKAHAITHLSLRDFRNHPSYDLDCEGGPIVLTGPNGAGKTNLLEAVSLLTPGRGMRQARFAAMVRQGGAGEKATGWTVSARLRHDGETHTIGSAYQHREGSLDKRLVRIDGETLRSASELAQYCAVLWLTPQMEQLFLEARSERRRFLDRLVYSFDPQQASRIHQYEHAMRERNRLLGLRQPDAAWLAVLEEKMAGLSVAIGMARVETVERLNRLLGQDALFAAPQLEVSGDAEVAVQAGEGALDVETRIAGQLASSREGDRASGRSAVGAHRTQLLVWHHLHRREAEFCSTGEQKAMLMAILLAQAESRARWRGSPPLLLLDEIVSHLDRAKRGELAERLSDLGAQLWMTGTDAADFSGFGRHFQHIPLT